MPTTRAFPLPNRLAPVNPAPLLVLNDFTTDILVIGAGQHGLAAGYYQRRAGLTFELLDN